MASLFFVAPMLLAYEAGVLVLGPQAVRNGADVWLRGLLDQIGFGQYFLLPLLTCSLLLAWHHTRRERWNVDWSVCYGMLAESSAFGLALLLVAQTQSTLFANHLPAAEVGAAASHIFGRCIGYFGAGIYEELLFRLMLLPAAIASLKWFGMSARWSVVTAVLGTSLLFSAAHYQYDFSLFGLHVASSYGDPFQLFSFSFRFLAGVFFSTLFVQRGFGVTAGSHALYDILIVVF